MVSGDPPCPGLGDTPGVECKYGLVTFSRTSRVEYGSMVEDYRSAIVRTILMYVDVFLGQYIHRSVQKSVRDRIDTAVRSPIQTVVNTLIET